MHLEEWRSGKWGRRLPGSMGSYSVHGFDLNLQNVVKAKFCPSVTLKFKNPMSVSDRYMCKTLNFYFLFALCHRSTGWLSIFQTLFQMVSLSMPIFIGWANCCRVFDFFPLSPLHHLLGFILGNWSHWGYWVYTFWFPGGTSEKKKNPADLFPSLDATS
jgi:hypothetical protein